MIILGLNVRQETEDCFSKFLCLKCFKMIKDIIKHHREVTIVKAKSLLDNNKDKWYSYSNINITARKVCTHRQSLSRGFFKKKEILQDAAAMEMGTTDVADHTNAADKNVLNPEG